ncbi:MAG: hypothetical protein QNJ46_06035 [Leptolyngbyaceae cyanobacterium MO_188.B28]|nr:hypothetical protein [Leptolyngbyaceae cyanobacterium MO_188.B28]
MDYGQTPRGFEVIEFEDEYGHACSLQKSSAADTDCIWLGINFPELRVMARDANNLGINTEITNGWVDYPIPQQVMVWSRMYLTQEQVKELLPYLMRFADTGQLGVSNDKGGS